MAGLSDRVGAVVLAYGDDSVRHHRLIDDLHRDGLGEDAITVVHNPSDRLRTTIPTVAGARTIVAPTNLGYAGGMNLGLADRVRAGDDVVVLLTHDIRLPIGVLAGLVDAVADGASIAGPPLLDGDETTWGGVLTRDLRPTASTTAATLPARVDWVDGCCMAVHLDVVRDVGWFDERYFMYFEETDLCMRVAAAGGRVVVADVSPVSHTSAGPSRGRSYTYLLARNDVLFRSRLAGPRGTWRSLRYRLVVSAQRRDELRTFVVPTILGIVDAMRGRFGSPPRRVTQNERSQR